MCTFRNSIEREISRLKRLIGKLRAGDRVGSAEGLALRDETPQHIRNIAWMIVELENVLRDLRSRASTRT